MDLNLSTIAVLGHREEIRGSIKLHILAELHVIFSESACHRLFPNILCA